MIKKIVQPFKYFSISFLILLSVLSCEKDFKNIGVNIVDNDVFSSEKYISEVIAYSKVIEKNRTNNIGNYLLGVHRDDKFGKLTASFVTQLKLASNNPDYGTNAVIDSVIIELPYTATLNSNTTATNTDKYVLDSVWTKGDAEFQLKVYKLGTFLTTQGDPPTVPKNYYSNYNFLKIEESLLYSGVVTPNPNDTLLIVDRYKHPNPNYPDLIEKEIYKKDTISGTNKPTLKIPLDKALIKQMFQDETTTTDFGSNSSFINYFRGLYFEASEINTDDAALINFDFTIQTGVFMSIYFSQDVQKDEADNEDLNGNGTNGEDDVWVRNPKSFKFPLKGVQANLYSRDISGSMFSESIPGDDVTGEEKLFVSGAAGSNVVIKLFGNNDEDEIPDELQTLRENNWLINDARLEVFIADNNTEWIPPNRLYLYNIEEEDDDIIGTQILDAMPQSALGINGVLVRTSDGTPEKYVFLLTDYISEILKSDSELELYDFGLKIFDPFDLPSVQFEDKKVKNFNRNPKGIILQGNKPDTQKNRIKLQISYTKKN